MRRPKYLRGGAGGIPVCHQAVQWTPKWSNLNPNPKEGDRSRCYVPDFLGGVVGQPDHGREDPVRRVLRSGEQAGHAHLLQQAGQVLGGALPHRSVQVAADDMPAHHE